MIDTEYKRDKEKDAKMSKNNIIAMTIIIVMFLIGIFLRWDFIKKEVSESIDSYINPEQTLVDSTKL